jgi:MOSC domain-containing protein YiiM
MIKTIFVARENKGQQFQVDFADLVQGKGIMGDRNFAKSKWPGQNITLIEIEEIDNYNNNFSQNIGLSDTRRNIVTQGIRLNELVGKEFRIGEVVLKGVELCEPCTIIGKLLENELMKQSDVVKAFLHKGGLRADVVYGGRIFVHMQFEKV